MEEEFINWFKKMEFDDFTIKEIAYSAWLFGTSKSFISEDKIKKIIRIFSKINWESKCDIEEAKKLLSKYI
jgi:hypothetical protein